MRGGLHRSNSPARVYGYAWQGRMWQCFTFWKKKKMYYIFPCQIRADEMPGPPGEFQVTVELFLDRHQ